MGQLRQGIQSDLFRVMDIQIFFDPRTLFCHIG